MRVTRNRISPARTQDQLIAHRQTKKKAISQPQTSAELAALLPKGDTMRRNLSPIMSPSSPMSRSPVISRSPRSEEVVRSREVLPVFAAPAEIKIEEPRKEEVVEFKVEMTAAVVKKEPVYRPNVLVVVLNKEGKVLCGERSDFKEESFWQCPQGGIDCGEDILEAAKREVQEELGLSPERLRPLPRDFQPSERFRYTFSAPVKKDGKFFDGQEQQVVMFVLDGDLDDCHLEVPGQPTEFKRVEWRSFSEIVPFVLPSKQQVYSSLSDVVERTLEACSPRFLADLLLVS